MKKHEKVREEIFPKRGIRGEEGIGRHPVGFREKRLRITVDMNRMLGKYTHV